MIKASVKKNEVFDVEKEERNRELRRNIVTGAILRDLHKKQGTMNYLIQVLEPYLTKDNRKLFGLPF